MGKLKIMKSDLGINIYRAGVGSVSGYNNSEFGTVSVAPLIHSYSPDSIFNISAQVALGRKDQGVVMNGQFYTIKRYVTVQCLSDSFFSDEDSTQAKNMFRPTVKPHYAIIPKNGKGNKFNEKCKSLVVENGEPLYQGKLSVHVHDRRLSPRAVIEPLHKRLQGSHYLVKDFGTSKSPKSTRQRAKYLGRDCPASGTLP